MFCPKCATYLTEPDLIKHNAKYMPGKREPVEYDARCPACHVQMGHISWGQLQVNPELEAERPAAEPDAAQEPAPDGVRAPAAPEPEAPRGKICPHCGKELPLDF